jgi:hypothetical protein
MLDKEFVMVDEDELHQVNPTPSPDVATVRSVFEGLQTQIRTLGSTQPGIHERSKHYQARRSYFERLVASYTSKPWWEKLFLGGLVFSTSYTLGVVIGSAFLISALVTGLYLLAVSVMEGHAGVMKEREEAIQAMEASFEKHMRSFVGLEEKFKEMFQSLDVLHDDRAQGIASFDVKLTTVDEQTIRYASILDSLSQSAEKLVEHQAQVNLDEQVLGSLSSELRQRFHEASDLCTMLSSYVAAAQHELKEKGVSEHPDKVEALVMKQQVEEGFSSLDREIELLLGSDDEPDAHIGREEDKDLMAIDQALEALKQADDKSKRSYVENRSKGTVCSFMLQ